MIRYRRLTKDELIELDIQKKSSWHRWFAWFPVRLTHDENEICFFEIIYRRGIRANGHVGEYWNWMYAETAFDILKIEDYE